MPAPPERGSSPHSATRPSPSTSWRSARTPTRWQPSASTPRTCSASGSGSAAATRSTRRSGCPLMIAIGAEHFAEFLAGFRLVDEHFRSAPLAENAPVVLGMIGVWNRNVLGLATKAVLPYAEELSRFPAYLQQLDMESNGKSVRLRRISSHARRLARSCGVNRARTVSTPSTNCSIRAPRSCRLTSSASPRAPPLPRTS